MYEKGDERREGRMTWGRRMSMGEMDKKESKSRR